MNSTKTPITQLLIASAIEPAVYRRLIESPEQTFDEFQVAAEDRELLRHPDHRLLRLLGAALAQESSPTPAAPTLPTPPVAAPGSPLPDISLLLTLQPCAQYDGTQLRNFAYAIWVTPLSEGVDPATLLPPAGTLPPGTPLAPLRTTIRVSALQLQDPAGNPLVGLTASLLNATNISMPPPPEAAGKPAAAASNVRSPEIQSALTAVRTAPASVRHEKLLDLLRILHPEGTS